MFVAGQNHPKISLFIFPLKHLIFLRGSFILKLKAWIGALKSLNLNNILDLGQISGSLLVGRNHTVSQICRVVKVGRGSLKVIWSNLLLRASLASKLDPVAHGAFQLSSENLWGRRSAQSARMYDCSPSEKKLFISSGYFFCCIWWPPLREAWVCRPYKSSLVVKECN